MTLAFRSMSLGRDNYSLGYGQRIGPDGAFGMLWLHGGTEVEGRDVSGEKTGRLLDSDNAVYLAFSREVWEDVSLGLAMKVLQHTLGGEDAKGFGFDLGVQARWGPYVTLGLAIRHLGAKMSWQTDRWDQATSTEDRVPMTVVTGASFQPLGRQWVVSADGIKTDEADPDLNAGMEWAPREIFAVRMGGREILNEQDRTWSAGLSLRMLLWTRPFRFDYAYVTDPLGAGDSQIFSMTLGM